MNNIESELRTRLINRQTAVAASVARPSIDDLLGSDHTLRPARYRRPAVAALAVASAAGIVIGLTVTLRRDQGTRVETRTTNETASDFADAPLLFPSDRTHLSTITAGARSTNEDGVVDANVDVFARGDVGERASFVTLVSTVATSSNNEADQVFSSLRPSGSFEPAWWLRDPDFQPVKGARYTLSQMSVPGADRAAIVEQPSRPTLIVAVRGDVHVVILTSGIATADARPLVERIEWTSSAAHLPNLPGMSRVIPAASRSAVFPNYWVSWDEGTMSVTSHRDAAYTVATTLMNGGTTEPNFTVERRGPQWVFSEDANAGRIVGLRGNAWVDLRAKTLTPVETFEGLRDVSSLQFRSAIERGRTAQQKDRRTEIDKVTTRVIAHGGWLPELSVESRIVDVNQHGMTAAFLGGMSGLRPLWNPTTGSTIHFAGTNVRDAGAVLRSDAYGDLIGTVDVDGSPSEIRRHSDRPGQLFVVTDRGSQEFVIITNDVDETSVRDIVSTIAATDSNRWSMPVPRGFEPIPQSRTIDSKRDSATRQRGPGINGIHLMVTKGDEPQPAGQTPPLFGASVDIYDIDPLIDPDIFDQFFAIGTVQRVTRGPLTWFQNEDGDIFTVLVPSTRTRPAVVAQSSKWTHDEVLALALSVAPQPDTEVRQTFASIR